MIVVIEAGCAECRGWDDTPLVVVHEFETIEAAKEWAQGEQWLGGGGPHPITWSEHPQGGEHVVSSQGSVWITPLSTMGRMFPIYEVQA